jgi:aminopeptidase-like protein
LAQHGDHLREKMKAGYVVTCVGDPGKFHYKRSRRGNSEADRAAEHFLKHAGGDFHAKDFVPDGSDERQYCSPGFNLPVGSLMRTSYYLYKEYHTSFDNKDFISFEAMKGTVEAYVEVCRILELNRKYKNLFPFGEPQLGKRGLYPDFVAPGGRRDYLDNLLFLLNFSDGENDLLDIANKRGRSALEFEDIIRRCKEAGILDVA